MACRGGSSGHAHIAAHDAPEQVRCFVFAERPSDDLKSAVNWLWGPILYQGSGPTLNSPISVAQVHIQTLPEISGYLSYASVGPGRISSLRQASWPVDQVRTRIVQTRSWVGPSPASAWPAWPAQRLALAMPLILGSLVAFYMPTLEQNKSSGCASYGIPLRSGLLDHSERTRASSLNVLVSRLTAYGGSLGAACKRCDS
jgi:hypothetical protein